MATVSDHLRNIIVDLTITTNDLHDTLQLAHNVNAPLSQSSAILDAIKHTRHAIEAATKGSASREPIITRAP